MANKAELQAARDQVIQMVTDAGGSMTYEELYEQLRSAGQQLGIDQIRDLRNAGQLEMQLQTTEDGQLVHRVGLPGNVKRQ